MKYKIAQIFKILGFWGFGDTVILSPSLGSCWLETAITSVLSFKVYPERSPIFIVF
jgi:hypothetical protein